MKRGGVKPLALDLRWTYPLREIRVVSNLGSEVHAPPAGEFGKAVVTIPVDTDRVDWLRVDIRDVAGNYCLSQPVAIVDAE